MRKVVYFSGNLEGVERKTFECTTTGRYLVIQMEAEDFLTLCEVMVFEQTDD